MRKKKWEKDEIGVTIKNSENKSQITDATVTVKI
jgi:hypothetical protein